MLKVRSSRFALGLLIAVFCATFLAPAAMARGRGAPGLVAPPPGAPSPAPPAGISK